ncbi:hypothetical protein D3C87_96170 [compost metagenome]
MKNFGLFILIFLVQWGVFAQRDAQYYQTEVGNYAFKLEENSCTLYTLSQNNQMISYESDLAATRKMDNPTDSLGILYSDPFFGISYDYRHFSVVQLKKGKIKKWYRAKKLENPGELFEAINHRHWDEAYDRMLDEVEHDYKLFGGYRYRDFDDSWQQVEFKQVSPEEFEFQAKQRIALEKAILVQTNQQLISLNDTIKNNIHTLTFEELKSNFQSRPLNEYAYGKYTLELLNTVSLTRPELYLELAEALPEEKKFLYTEAAFNRDMHRSIKKNVEPGPVKNAYMKFRRWEHFKAGLVLTGVAILDVGIITGVFAIFL